MSDAAEKAEDILVDGAEIEQEVQAQDDTENQNSEPDDSEPRGYMTKEAWVASGKDPKDWVSAEGFKLRGEHIKHTQALRRDFENQIKNLSLLHQVQLKAQRDDLLSKRDDAIDIADKAAVKAIDKQIKDLDDIERLNTPAPASAAKAPEILEWEADNPWSQDPSDPRLALANSVCGQALRQGKTLATALRLVDQEIARAFTQKTGDRRQIVEGNRTAGGKRDEPALTMRSLTSDERKYWETGMFASEKDFLKAVTNARKGEK
jgi:hypothetical protein